MQEASLRAFRYFRTFTGGNGHAWFLRIVRNTCSGWRGHQFEALADPFDEEEHNSIRPAYDPERLLLQTDDVTLLERAIGRLPKRFRDVLVLRELEELSYRELADGMGIPIGTVMSSLSRARRALCVALDNELKRTGSSKTVIKSRQEMASPRERRASIPNVAITHAPDICDSPMEYATPL